MISNKKNGLSVSLMATRVMPSLLPQTMNPSLSLEQFSNLLEVLQEMLDHIDRYELGRSIFVHCPLLTTARPSSHPTFFFLVKQKGINVISSNWTTCRWGRARSGWGRCGTSTARTTCTRPTTSISRSSKWSSAKPAARKTWSRTIRRVSCPALASRPSNRRPYLYPPPPDSLFFVTN